MNVRCVCFQRIDELSLDDTGRQLALTAAPECSISLHSRAVLLERDRFFCLYWPVDKTFIQTSWFLCSVFGNGGSRYVALGEPAHAEKMQSPTLSACGFELMNRVGGHASADD